MRMSSKMCAIGLAVVLGAVVFACSNGNTPASPSNASPSSSASGGAATSTGTLSIHLTDSPFSQAQALLVTFSEVSVHSADPGDWQTLSFLSGSSRTCDLKRLQGATDILGTAALKAGKYTQIRLNVTSAAIYFDEATTGSACAPQIAAPTGASASVDIPSGEVKLNNEFTLTSAGTKITLDFDGDQSIHQTGGGSGNANTKYIMNPVIRIASVQ